MRSEFLPAKKPAAPSVRRGTPSRLAASERDRLLARIAQLEEALRHFTFPASPDAFVGDAGSCTQVIVVDQHVLEARRLLGAGYRRLATLASAARPSAGKRARR